MKEAISKIACISTKLGKASIALLEALTIPEVLRKEKLEALKSHLGVTEILYLATCNRVEFMVITPIASTDVASLRNRILDFFFDKTESTDQTEFEPDNFRLFSGREAVKHIFEVASSLDSLVIGEAQILGQVKEAHRYCQDNGLSGNALDRLLSTAYKAAKIVRTDTDLGKRPVSMASLVGMRTDEILIENQEAVIAIIGSGPMTPKMADIIRKEHKNKIYFVNRTVAKVAPFAEKYDGQAVELTDFIEGKFKADIIITSTSSPEPIITSAGLRNLMTDKNKIYAFDLAIPRDFEATLVDSDKLEIWNSEKLNILAQKNRRERFRLVDQAGRLLDEQVKQYIQKEITQMISPLFDSALDESMAMAQEGLSNLFKSKLSHLSSNDQELLVYWSKKVLARACYLPAKQLAAHIADSDFEQDLRLSHLPKNAR
jgi:glutamyl-tRNA reductase